MQSAITTQDSFRNAFNKTITNIVYTYAVGVPSERLHDDPHSKN